MEPITEIREHNFSFKNLGLCAELCLACEKLQYEYPTQIQVEAIPYALQKKDIIGLALTGSGKTAAFALPILQHLLQEPTPCYALVLTPVRELAIQISEQFEALGAFIGLKTTVLVGGLDLTVQAISLSKNPHIIIGTPGRVVDHLQNTKGFNLSKLQFLVIDEADRLLNMDFEKEINLIVSSLPAARATFLFSATMTNKVQKLQRACLKRDAVKINVSTKYQTVESLTQQYVFLPAQYKDTYLYKILTDFMGNSIMIFSDSSAAATKLTLILNKLAFRAVALFGKLSQPKRLEALNKFKSKGRNILVATDVASRGLDIPLVDLVINYDVPQQSKSYIHRVGRTARAGRAGRAITLITQYDVHLFQKVEALIGIKMGKYDVDHDLAMIKHEELLEVTRNAVRQIKEDNEEESAGKKNKNKNRKKFN